MCLARKTVAAPETYHAKLSAFFDGPRALDTPKQTDNSAKDIQGQWSPARRTHPSYDWLAALKP